MRQSRLILSLILICFALTSFSQNPRTKIDSLLNDVKHSGKDTSLCWDYILLGNAYIDLNYDTAFIYATKADAIALKLNNKRLTVNSKAILGKVYMNQERYADALKIFFEALPIAEELHDLSLQHRINNNVGNVYSYLKQGDNSLKYFLSAAKIAIAAKDRLATAKYYVNIGTAYKRMKKMELGINFYNKALAEFKALNYSKGKMQCYINISTLYAKDFPKAEYYLLMALPIADSLHDYNDVMIIFNNIAAVNAEMKKYDKSISYFDSTLFYAKRQKSFSQVSDVYGTLAQVYAERKNFEKAYYYANLNKHMDDSINNSMNMEQIANDESKYEFLNKEKELELLKKNDKINELENGRKNFWLILLVLGFLLLGVLVFLFYYRYQQKNKQTALLQEHNAEIELRKKEITDSINYAKRIQMSILPPDSMVEKILPNSFVLYKPKDIVSGDFYWVEECDGKSLFASVDCTGHGVPGAMMSVLGFNLLSQSVNERRLTKPSSILEHLDQGVDKMLRQSTDMNSVRDGMDLSLCSLDLKTGVLQFAGAYNPLWVVKKDKEFIEVKADKMMIGVNAGGQGDQFTNHEMQLQKGDTIYIFSDGYADQFGGAKGKKFKYKPMKEFLISNQHLSMNEQKIKLDDEIEKWRGNLEQVDDILVIGVRV